MGSVGKNATFSAYTDSSGVLLSNFTQDEIKAIRNLTGGTVNAVSAGEKMNKQLRTYGSGVLTSAGNKIMTNLDSALNKYQVQKPFMVYRGGGSGLLGGASTLEQVQALIGKTVQDNGYMSTSVNSDEMFKHKAIHYEIQVPVGVGIGAPVYEVSKHPDEQEFTFARRSQFVVTGVKQTKDGKLSVSLRYVGKGNTDIDKNYYSYWLQHQ